MLAIKNSLNKACCIDIMLLKIYYYIKIKVNN